MDYFLSALCQVRSRAQAVHERELFVAGQKIRAAKINDEELRLPRRSLSGGANIYRVPRA